MAGWPLRGTLTRRETDREEAKILKELDHGIGETLMKSGATAAAPRLSKETRRRGGSEERRQIMVVSANITGKREARTTTGSDRKTEAETRGTTNGHGMTSLGL
jgi:hypothetical protein